MPFSTSRYPRLKIIACLCGALQLVGCAGPKQASAPVVVEDRKAAELVELFGGGPESSSEAGKSSTAQPSKEAPAPSEKELTPFSETFPEVPEVSFSPLPAMDVTAEIYHWDVITGGTIGNVATGEVQSHFQEPVAVAVRGDYIYVVDTGLDEVLRYNQKTGRLSSILDLKADVTGQVADIYVAKDFSFYITDTEGRRVLKYSPSGSLEKIFRSYYNLTRPVAVNLLDNGDIVVADAFYDQLLEFNADGKLVATYGKRGEGAAEFINITNMTLGPDGYYVGARVGHRLQVLSLNGEYNYSFEEGKVVFPTAIAVDKNNRSYVADMMDNQIKVFDRGRLIATIGGAGAAPGRFMRITDLWLDDRFLYIVDSLNARIQVARLVPEGILPGTEPVSKQ